MLAASMMLRGAGSANVALVRDHEENRLVGVSGGDAPSAADSDSRDLSATGRDGPSVVLFATSGDVAAGDLCAFTRATVPSLELRKVARR